MSRPCHKQMLLNITGGRCCYTDPAMTHTDCQDARGDVGLLHCCFTAALVKGGFHISE